MQRPDCILDLDQTLIYAVPIEQLSQSRILKPLDAFWTKNHSVSHYYDMDNDYRVFERPYLQEFLDFVFEHFNVTIWTFANFEYCYNIMENIIFRKNRDFRHSRIKAVLYSTHCERSQAFIEHCTANKVIPATKHTLSSPKHIEFLLYHYPSLYNVRNLVFFDDNHHVQAHNKRVIIVTPEFIASDPKSLNDRFLKESIKKLRARLMAYSVV